MSDDADRTIYDDFDPEAPETTEFRRILTRISRRGQKEKIRTLLVTSAERGEGKTTSAAMFAVVASLHQGFRTCLVDADLHRPRIAKLFDTDQDPGLAEILGDDLSIESALQWCRYDNLRIIPAGAKRPLPSELLETLATPPFSRARSTAWRWSCARGARSATSRSGRRRSWTTPARTFWVPS